MRVYIVVGSVFTIILLNNAEGKFNLEGLKKMTKPFKAPCIKQSGVSPELVDEGNSGNITDDPQLKCYYMCLLQKLKVIKGGKLTVGSMKAQVQALVEESLVPRLTQMVDACENASHDEDLCEASYEFIKCTLAFDSTLHFFP